jgi:hypothetical protein
MTPFNIQFNFTRCLLQNDLIQIIEIGWNVPRKTESRIRCNTMVGKPLIKCQFRLLTYRWVLGKTAANCLGLVRVMVFWRFHLLKMTSLKRSVAT